MMQTLTPYPSKTDEIMSRYRPIAPKPIPNQGGSSGGGDSGSLAHEKLKHSPYFRSIWSQLQARPTRTRRRGRSAAIPTPTAFSRRQHEQHAQTGGYSSPDRLITDCIANESIECLITLPLLTCEGLGEIKKGIDLNSTTDVTEEKDDKGLLLQLSSRSFLSSPSSPSPFSNGWVISPRPVRPVGSTITVVGPISEDLTAPPPELASATELESAGEAESIPMVILDRKNNVRMVNSAYKELVGQPECAWLGSMAGSSGPRISGEIIVRLPGPAQIPCSGNRFSCWVRIEWEGNGKKKWVNAFSEAMKLACESKDYNFSWRFYTREISLSS